MTRKLARVRRERRVWVTDRFASRSTSRYGWMKSCRRRSGFFIGKRPLADDNRSRDLALNTRPGFVSYLPTLRESV